MIDNNCFKDHLFQIKYNFQIFKIKLKQKNQKENSLLITLIKYKRILIINLYRKDQTDLNLSILMKRFNLKDQIIKSNKKIIIKNNI